MKGKASVRRRVLVIDDSETARQAIRELLEQADYDVVVLPSAIGATRVILQQQIEAAIIDLSMPGLSGDRLVAVLRGNPRLANLVLIVVSGEDESQLDALRHKIDVQAIMSKATVKYELLPLLGRLFARQRSSAVL